ncbi:hypothetical protein L1276_002678 [Flavobacterium sp. HSC-32F16]|nr:hypothetical protein [Flavobacterium sp. HSC-32F16]
MFFYAKKYTINKIKFKKNISLTILKQNERIINNEQMYLLFCSH